jgi:D-xylose transport system ATP-binding protein
MAAQVEAKTSSVGQIVELITSGRSGDIGLSTAAANASM